MNIRAEITTTEIRRIDKGAYTCELHVNGVWSGDLHRPSREELTSLCDLIKGSTDEKG